jgi:hypothetical protein
MQILKAGALYFALELGAGFVLGAIRIMWVVPRFGTRMAELMETPVMEQLSKSRTFLHTFGLGWNYLRLRKH